MKKIFNLILVDESGSMSSIQHQAFTGINETLATCKAAQENLPDTEQRVTLITFDSEHYKIHYDNILATEAALLPSEAYQPGCCTPLYDAIGRSLSRLIAQATADDGVFVTIITDGYENASREYSLTMVKNLIEKQKKAGWSISLIGTDNIDVEGMANSMNINHHMSFPQDDEGTKMMFRKVSSARLNASRYFCEGKEMPKDNFFKDADYMAEAEEALDELIKK